MIAVLLYILSFVYLQSFMKLFKIMIKADFIRLKSTVAKRDVKWLYRTHKALISSEVRKSSNQQYFYKIKV